MKKMLLLVSVTVLCATTAARADLYHNQKQGTLIVQNPSKTAVQYKINPQKQKTDNKDTYTKPNADKSLYKK